MKQQLNIRLPEKERRRLDNHAKAEERSVSDILREFIRSLPEPEQKGNQTANATR